MLRNIFLFLFFVLCVTIIVNTNIGMAMGNKPDYKSEVRSKLKKIDVSDGVDKREAVILAQNYLIDEGLDKMYLISSARVIESSYEKLEYWCVRFSTFSKIKLKQGLEWGIVYIDKKTGKVKEGGSGPS